MTNNQVIKITSDIELLVTIPMSISSNLSKIYIKNTFENIFKTVKERLRFFNLPSKIVFELRIGDGCLTMQLTMPLEVKILDVVNKVIKEVNKATVKANYIKSPILSSDGITIKNVLTISPSTPALSLFPVL